MSRFIELNQKLTGRFDFHVLQVDITEALSQPFIGKVTLISQHGYSDFSDIVGQELALTFSLENNEKRYLHGIIQQLTYQHHQGRFHYYEATVVPRLALLNYQTDCRIFQNISVPDIVNTILKEHGYSAEYRLIGSYAPRVYCTQYRESQLDFIQRLLAEEGIYYSFIHSDTDHQLVLYDYNGNHDSLPVHPSLVYAPSSENAPREDYCVQSWQPNFSLQTGAYHLRDYNYKQPGSAMDAIIKEPDIPEHGHYQRYDFAGPEQYVNQDAGSRYATVRLEEQQCQVQRIEARANTAGLQPGYLWRLDLHPNIDQNQEYLILSTHLRAKVSDHDSGSVDGQVETSTTFVVLPDTRQYRPAYAPHKKLVAGPQTAVVVGPEGEEIYTDEYGRVKCQFHWDRLGQQNQDSSCWIRVSQNWGGAGWGHIAIPRIGQEVIVDFLEGDPDQPIITGRTYNGKNDVPYKLPEHKTRMSIKSKTYKGSGFNELRFEDKPDEEELFIHAQKDQNNVVLNNETTQVGVDRTEHVGNDEAINIGRDVRYQVGQNQFEAYGKDLQMQVGNSWSESIHYQHQQEVGQNKTTRVKGKYNVEVIGGIRSNTNKHEIMGSDKVVITGGSSRVTISGGQITLEASKINLKGKVSIGGSGGASVPPLIGAAESGLPLSEECPLKKS